MVITTTIANWKVHKILIDQGSSADVLYWLTFLKLDVPESAIQAYSKPLLSFAGQKVLSRGFIDLLTTFGIGQSYRTLTVRYILVDADTTYNVLIGRRTLNQLGAIVSTPHMAMKYPASNGMIIKVKADPKETRQCYMQSLKVTPYTLRTAVEEQAAQVESAAEQSLATATECNNVELRTRPELTKEDRGHREIDLDPRAEFEDGRPTFHEPLTTVALGTDPLGTTRVGLTSSQEIRAEIERVLATNADIFTWSPADMPGIDSDFICHKLALLPQAKPIAQRKRKLGEERRAVVE